MKMADEAGNAVDLPHLDQRLMSLVKMLFDAGPVSAGGSAPLPLTWVDLDAWQRVTGVALPPGQLRLLRRLSCDYLDEANRATEHDAPPPWQRDMAQRRALVARHIRNVFRG